MATAKRTAKPAAADAATANGTAEAAFSAAQTAAEDAFKAAAVGYEKVIEMSKEQAEKAGVAFFADPDEATKFARKNADAVRESSVALTQGLEDAGKRWAGLAQEAVDDSFAVAGRLAAAKDLQDMARIQVAWAQDSLNRFVQASGEMQRLSRTVAEQTAAPITARATAIYQQFQGDAK